MLPVATLFGLATYSSARTPLKDLVPWMPIVLSLFLLLTAYTLPRFWPRSDYQGYSPINREISLEDGHSQRSRGSSRATPWHVQTRENSRSREGSPIMVQYRPHWCPHWFQEHQVSHMSRPTSRSLRFPSEQRDSDIDLSEHPLTGQESPSTEDILFSLPQAEFPSADLPLGSVWSSRDMNGEEDRSSSADSQAVHYTSTPGRLESPLHEDSHPNDFIIS